MARESQKSFCSGAITFSYTDFRNKYLQDTLCVSVGTCRVDFTDFDAVWLLCIKRVGKIDNVWECNALSDYNNSVVLHNVKAYQILCYAHYRTHVTYY